MKKGRDNDSGGGGRGRMESRGRGVGGGRGLLLPGKKKGRNALNQLALDRLYELSREDKFASSTYYPRIFKRAMESLAKCPLHVTTYEDAIALDGVGKFFANKIASFHAIADNNPGANGENDGDDDDGGNNGDGKNSASDDGSLQQMPQPSSSSAAVANMKKTTKDRRKKAKQTQHHAPYSSSCSSSSLPSGTSAVKASSDKAAAATSGLSTSAVVIDDDEKYNENEDEKDEGSNEVEDKDGFCGSSVRSYGSSSTARSSVPSASDAKGMLKRCNVLKRPRATVSSSPPFPPVGVGGGGEINGTIHNKNRRTDLQKKRMRTRSTKEVAYHRACEDGERICGGESLAYDYVQWNVILLVDVRERKCDHLRANLLQQGCLCETRQLPIGDMLWIARGRRKKRNISSSSTRRRPLTKTRDNFNTETTTTTSSTSTKADKNDDGDKNDDKHETIEVVLGTIIERKTSADLASSLYGTRFEEQRLRLKKSAAGASQVIFLVEGETLSDVPGCPASTLRYALRSSMVHLGFAVIRTQNFDDTCQCLRRVHTQLTRRAFFSSSSSSSSSRMHLDTFQHPPIPPFGEKRLVLYEELKTKVELARERGTRSIGSIFRAQLKQVESMSIKKVEAICRVYQTPQSLFDAYDNNLRLGGADDEDNEDTNGSANVESLVENIPLISSGVERSSRVGPKSSKELCYVFTEGGSRNIIAASSMTQSSAATMTKATTTEATTKKKTMPAERTTAAITTVKVTEAANNTRRTKAVAKGRAKANTAEEASGNHRNDQRLCTNSVEEEEEGDHDGNNDDEVESSVLMSSWRRPQERGGNCRQRQIQHPLSISVPSSAPPTLDLLGANSFDLTQSDEGDDVGDDNEYVVMNCNNCKDDEEGLQQNDGGCEENKKKKTFHHSSFPPPFCAVSVSCAAASDVPLPPLSNHITDKTPVMGNRRRRQNRNDCVGGGKIFSEIHPSSTASAALSSSSDAPEAFVAAMKQDQLSALSSLRKEIIEIDSD